LFVLAVVWFVRRTEAKHCLFPLLAFISKTKPLLEIKAVVWFVEEQTKALPSVRIKAQEQLCLVRSFASYGQATVLFRSSVAKEKDKAPNKRTRFFVLRFARPKKKRLLLLLFGCFASFATVPSSSEARYGKKSTVAFVCFVFGKRTVAVAFVCSSTNQTTARERIENKRTRSTGTSYRRKQYFKTFN
jgi:hypothetical protein